MKKVTRQQARSGRTWTGADRMRLQRMAQHDVPVATIAKRLCRTEAAVRTEARKQHVDLAPSPVQLTLTGGKEAYGGIAVQAPQH